MKLPAVDRIFTITEGKGITGGFARSSRGDKGSTDGEDSETGIPPARCFVDARPTAKAGPSLRRMTDVSFPKCSANDGAEVWKSETASPGGFRRLLMNPPGARPVGAGDPGDSSEANGQRSRWPVIPI